MLRHMVNHYDIGTSRLLHVNRCIKNATLIGIRTGFVATSRVRSVSFISLGMAFSRSIHMTSVVYVDDNKNITDISDFSFSEHTNIFLGSNYYNLSGTIRSLGNLTGHIVSISNSAESNPSVDLYTTILYCVMGFLVVSALFSCTYTWVKPLACAKRARALTPSTHLEMQERNQGNDSSQSVLSIVEAVSQSPSIFNPTLLKTLNGYLISTIDMSEGEIDVMDLYQAALHHEHEVFSSFVGGDVVSDLSRIRITSDSNPQPTGDSIDVTSAGLEVNKVTSTPVKDRTLSVLKDSGLETTGGDSLTVSKQSKHVTWDLPVVERPSCHCVITIDSDAKTTVLEVREHDSVLPPPLSYEEAQRGYEAIITYPYDPKS